MGGNEITFAYFGSGGISLTVLEELERAGFVPSLIVAPPDKPKGRNLELTPPEIKDWALEHNILYIQPSGFKDAIPELLENGIWDFFVVVSYGYILPKELLDLPEHGVINVHPSLLPKFRGASPIQSAILADEKETGVTIMLLDEEMDHGPIIAQASVAPEPWPPRASDLIDLLGQVGGQLLAETLQPWLNGEINIEEQDHTKATFTKKLKRDDGLVDLNNNSYQNLLKIRALDPWPGTHFFVEKNGKKIRVKIVDADIEDDLTDGKAGKLVIKSVIPEGKKEMNFEDFLNK